MTPRRKLGVLASHPIQYQAPIFRELARHVDLRVFFAHRQTPRGQADAGFAVPFEWDVNLLSGYSHEFLQNEARHPDSASFFGCDTPGIKAAIADAGFDAFLVMGWNLKAYWQAVRACKRHHVPVLVRGDSQLGTGRGFVKRAVKKLAYPAMLRQFDACLFVGHHNRVYLAHYGVPANRLYFSPHCVDNQRFAVAAASCDREELRRRLGLDSDARVALFVGKLTQMKRPGDLIEAIGLLHRRGVRIQGLLVGDGPLRSELEQQAAACTAAVAFAGFWNQQQLPQAYAAADVLVLPSTAGETWGLVVNEAMACGLPAVVSDAVGCAPDLVIPGCTGETFAMGDPRSLAAALERVLNTPTGREAIQELIGGYSVTAAASGILAAMDEVHAARSQNG